MANLLVGLPHHRGDDPFFATSAATAESGDDDGFDLVFYGGQQGRSHAVIDDLRVFDEAR